MGIHLVTQILWVTSASNLVQKSDWYELCLQTVLNHYKMKSTEGML